jgi:hypothetical protein
MEKRRRNASPLGAVLLILAGGILLLNVFNVLDWSIWWSIVRLWPLLLVAAGLELLLGRSRLGALLATILVIALAAGALWLLSAGVLATGMETAQISQPLGDATRADVSINPAVGELWLEAAPEAANLVEGEIHHGANEDIQESYSQEGDTATYNLSTGSGSWGAFPGGWDQSRAWELSLSPGASLALNADMAVGDNTLDLTGLTLEDLNAEMGVGRLKVTLPATGQFTAKVSQGVGLVEIVIPKGMAVRIETDTALAGRQMPDDLVKDEEVYSSPGYSTAANRVEIEASVAIGLLKVRYQE